MFEKKQKQIEIKRSLKFLEFTGIAADCVIVDGILWSTHETTPSQKKQKQGKKQPKNNQKIKKN